MDDSWSVSAVFISPLKTPPVSVWIARNPKMNATGTRRAQGSCRAVLETLRRNRTLGDGWRQRDSPTNPMIMRRLKVIAPATTEQLLTLSEQRVR